MPQNIPCQICEQNDWDVIASKTFYKDGVNSTDMLTRNIYKYMFETWFPANSEIHFQNLYCKKCGFIRHSPRPTEEEMDTLRSRNAGSIIGYNPKTDMEMAAKRSRLLFEYLNKNIALNKVKKVLDYGGGDGNLLKEFLDRNMDCSLVDYCPYHIPGINKIGSTVYDLDEDNKFDLIICSHVIEHVTDPQKVVKALLSHLKDTGVLFIEVPMELWKYPPLLKQPNPITHLNFFSPNSLRNLLITSGGSIEKHHLIEFVYSSSHWNPGLRCIARKNNSPSKSNALVKPDSMDFLKPGLRAYIKYYFGYPKLLRLEIMKRISPKRCSQPKCSD
jgi:2-polyprenyl-3-methyl-5-hydroxy-6-metoxy-1,4-benzoquinol methylase